MNYIPLSVPSLKGREKEYVIDAIEKEWVSTGGDYIERLEINIADYLEVNCAIACQSGTAGLHLALILSGVQEHQEVIVPTLTFIAAINPVKYVGAHPIFMDCDESLTIDCIKLSQFIEEECEYINNKVINKRTKRQIKAIVVVHVFGNAANMEAIMEIANKYELKVIEDATEALGSYFIEGKYKGKYLGTIGDFGVYSFNGNKIITTGGGGMLVARDEKLLQKARYLSTQAKDDPLFYQHDEIGYNYRMTNLQAAVGVAQLEQLEIFIENKRKKYELYKELFKDNEKLRVVEFSENIRANYWFYSIIIKKDIINMRSIIEHLQDKGIQTRPVWRLIHKQKPYQLSQSYNINKALYYENHILNVPCSSNLSEEEVYYVVDTLKKVISEQ